MVFILVFIKNYSQIQLKLIDDIKVALQTGEVGIVLFKQTDGRKEKRIGSCISGIRNNNTFTVDFSNEDYGYYIVACANSYTGHMFFGVILNRNDSPNINILTASTISTTISASTNGKVLTLTETGTIGNYMCEVIRC